MKALIRPSARAAAAALLLVSVSCGEVARTGRSPAMLIIQSLEAASGADPQAFSGFLLSDVQTLVARMVGGVETQVPITYNDVGQATLRIELKDQGGAGAPSSASPLNQVTVNRYRIAFLRTDGRNTPGVDVPFPTDGAVTATIGLSPVTLGFEMVRHQAKLEAPLKPLAGFGGRLFVTTRAEVTFYGTDLAGNAVQATGYMNVSFADYADPS